MTKYYEFILGLQTDFENFQFNIYLLISSIYFCMALGFG